VTDIAVCYCLLFAAVPLFLIIHERIAELCRVRPSPWVVWPATFRAELAGVGTRRRLAVHRFLTQCLPLQLSRLCGGAAAHPVPPCMTVHSFVLLLQHGTARITAASCHCNRSIQYSKEKRVAARVAGHTVGCVRLPIATSHWSSLSKKWNCIRRSTDLSAASVSALAVKGQAQINFILLLEPSKIRYCVNCIRIWPVVFLKVIGYFCRKK